MLCAAAAGAYAFLFVLWDDTTAPKITMTSDVLEVSVGADDEELLSGVTAQDHVDGITGLNDQSEATITYAAFDQAGNVAKASRTLRYTDHRSPRFSLSDSLTFATNRSADVLSCVHASDGIDGDISDRVKGTLVSDTGSLSNPGLHEVEFRVTNSMGDTQYLTLPVEIYASDSYNASLQLTDYLVYLPVGAAFDPEDYLKSLTAGGSTYSLKNQTPRTRVYINNYVNPASNTSAYVSIVNVDMESNVDTSVPGVYSVTYEAAYEDLYTGCARLNVVVEE